jgi:hypothetical protein
MIQSKSRAMMVKKKKTIMSMLRERERNNYRRRSSNIPPGDPDPPSRLTSLSLSLSPDLSLPYLSPSISLLTSPSHWTPPLALALALALSLVSSTLKGTPTTSSHKRSLISITSKLFRIRLTIALSTNSKHEKSFNKL